MAIVNSETLSPPDSTLPPGASGPPIYPRRSHGGQVIAAVVAVVVVLGGLALWALLPSSPGHQWWTNLTRGSQVSTIQGVIQRANSEQSQALASNDPSVMSDTATADYYRQLAQTNQDLTAQGVTRIQMTNLTWGPININGSTATATTYETWVTTLSDGTTDESTDTNVYTVVQQNGTWLIGSDEHPAASSSPGQPEAPALAQPTPLPAGPTSPAVSHNWSGYVATSGTFTGVSGTWSVPQPSTGTSTTVIGATWVGIGGVNSHDLIQAGTQDVTVGGQHEFQTWIEMLPGASQQVPLAVAPDDSVTVSIDESSPGSNSWQISMKNNTSGQSYQTTVQYNSSQSSAEWIEEAPAGGNGNVIEPLDNFGTLAFSGATAEVNGQSVGLTEAGAQSVTMVNATNQPLAVPSAIGSDGASFSVTRTSAPASSTPIGRSGQRAGSVPPAAGR